MIAFPFKRIYALVGAMRTGKDSVANFLTETRGFKQIAFADQIKEDLGISKEDFEAAKIAGNIEELRTKLWAFSAQKKKNDSYYFIRKVIEKAVNSDESVIITDIRTPEELAAFLHMELNKYTHLKRIYWVRGQEENEFDENRCLAGSKLPESTIANYISPGLPEYDVRMVFNQKQSGLYSFYQQLDRFFFCEDIRDIWEDKEARWRIWNYIDQFEVRQKGI